MIQIDTESSVPLEEQIVSEIRHAIARGEVAANAALPSARQLGADLDVHWNTVARAYRRLQTEGLVSVGRGRGVFVRALPQAPATNDSPKRAHVTDCVRQAVTAALLAGMSMDDLRDLLSLEAERSGYVHGRR